MIPPLHPARICNNGGGKPNQHGADSVKFMQNLDEILIKTRNRHAISPDEVIPIIQPTISYLPPANAHRPEQCPQHSCAQMINEFLFNCTPFRYMVSVFQTGGRSLSRCFRVLFPRHLSFIHVILLLRRLFLFAQNEVIRHQSFH